MRPPPLVAVMGPTGAGKSAVAEQTADALGLRLVNADAFQVYRGFDIGTNKSERKADYALMDVCDPRYQFGVGEWLARVGEVLEGLWEVRRGALVVGGTGLYIRALFEEFDGLHGEPAAELRASLAREEDAKGTAHMVARLLELDPTTKVSVSNPLRVRRALERLLCPKPLNAFRLPPFRKYKFALWPDPVVLNDRLETRTKALLQAGWPQEVRCLMEQGVTKEAPAMRAIGYQLLVDHLLGELVEDEVQARITEATRRYAKRQRTWLRSEPGLVKLGMESLHATAVETATRTVLEHINSLETNQING